MSSEFVLSICDLERFERGCFFRSPLPGSQTSLCRNGHRMCPQATATDISETRWQSCSHFQPFCSIVVSSFSLSVVWRGRAVRSYCPQFQELWPSSTQGSASLGRRVSACVAQTISLRMILGKVIGNKYVVRIYDPLDDRCQIHCNFPVDDVRFGFV